MDIPLVFICCLSPAFDYWRFPEFGYNLALLELAYNRTIEVTLPPRRVKNFDGNLYNVLDSYFLTYNQLVDPYVYVGCK